MSYLAAALLVLAAGPSNAPSKNVQWRWDKDSIGCALQQEIDKAGDVLRVSRVAGSDQTGINIQNRASGTSSLTRFSRALVTIEPGGSTVADGYIGPGGIPKSRIVSVLVNDQKFMDQLSKASGLILSHPTFGSVRAPVRSATAAVLALRKCEDRNMREWSIDPVAWRALQTRPVPIGRTVDWLDDNDYPRKALLYRAQGTVIVRLTVDPDGAVRKCTGVRPLGNLGLIDATCQALTRRARFHPALDQLGRPVVAPFILIARFRVIG